MSIQIEREFDVFEKRWDERVFIKLFVAARTSGLLAAMPDRDWKMLCTMSTFMDKDGNCYPSQAELARALKINRSTANRRIKSLLAFRFKDDPVVLKVRVKGERGKFGRNLYTILPITHLKIFDRDEEQDSNDEKD